MPFKTSEEKLAYMKEYNARQDVKDKQSKWREDNKERIALNDRKRILKKKYNITMEEYNKMFADQNGCCKICGDHYSSLAHGLVVDHCHITGNVRSLLCGRCNTAIGLFKEDVETIKNAIEYLRK